MSANDRQEGGEHYRKGVQHWDAIKDWMTPDQYRGYLLGSASKYLARYNKKDGANGAKKSIHYLEKLIEFEEELAEESPKVAPKKPEPKSLTPEEVEKFRNQTLTQKLFHPSSTPEYTYEGGTARKDMYRCRKCKEHFEVPRGELPVTYHAHPEEPTNKYVDQG